MNVALRAVWEALGSSEQGASKWRQLMGQLSARVDAGRLANGEAVASALRSCGIGGSASAWLAHLRRLGVVDQLGRLDADRSEAAAVALDLVGDSFRSLGHSAGWALVATLPQELRSLIDPPPLRQTGGVLLELIDGCSLDLQLAMPFVDDAAVAYLLEALLGAGRRGTAASVITSTNNGRKFSELARRWPRGSSGAFRVIEVATHLSPLGSHAKALVVDRSRGYVGSANLTSAGLGRNIEIGVEITGPQVTDLSRVLTALERLGTTVETAGSTST